MLLVGLLHGGLLVEFGRQSLGESGPQGFLDKATRRTARFAGKPLGLDSGLAIGRDYDLDQLAHATPPISMVSLIEPSASVCSVTVWPRLRGFELRPFGGIGLQELIELGLISPSSAVVVKLDVPLAQVADDRVAPTWQLNSQTSGFGSEQLDRLMNGLWQLQAPAGGLDGHGITNLGLDLNDVRQVKVLLGE